MRRRLAIRLRTWLVRLGFLLGRLRPIRDEVVLASARTNRLGGNLAYIRDELERRDPPVPYRVVAVRTRAGMAGRIDGLTHAIRAGYRLAVSRLFVVDDYYFPMYVIRPRAGTFRVQTWHASGAFKKIGWSVLDKTFGADPDLVARVRIHSNYDLCLMPSEGATEHYMDAFRQPRERFTTAIGLPRTDLLFDPGHRDRASAAIRARYRLPAGKRVLLYAPTFRGDTVLSARYDDDLDLGVMHAALAGEWVVLMRLHPFVRKPAAITPELAGFAVDASDWPDINELMFVADLLVTDYSSAIYEFSLLGRPMAFFAPDYESYERERGFYFDYRTGVPGPIFETTEALAAYVRAGSFDEKASEAFADASFRVADGHASARFVDRVVLPALAGAPIDPEGAHAAG